MVGQVNLVIGPSGSGKTAGRVAWLVREWFPDARFGTLITNLPLNVERIREHFNDLHKRGKCSESGDAIAKRIMFVPREWIEGWKNKDHTFEPQYLLESIPGACRIMLDEVHHFYSKHDPSEWQTAWKAFFDEGRHAGGQFEILTQAAGKLPWEFRSACESEIFTVSARVKKDPLFGIEYNDWYNVLASWRRKWCSAVWYIEKHQSSEGVRTKNGETKMLLSDWIFGFYDSHNKTENSQKSVRIAEQWEVCSRGELLRWFWRRNWTKLLWGKFPRAMYPVALLCVVCFVMLANFDSVLSWSTSFATSVIQPGASQPAKVGSVAQSVVQVVPAMAPTASSAAAPPESAPTRAQVELVESRTVELGLMVPEFVVNLFDQDGAWIDGKYCQVGEVVDVRNGVTLQSVDFVQRVGMLSDGRRLSFERAAAGSVVEKRVQAAPGGRQQSESSAGGRPARQVERVGSAGL